MAQFFIYLQLYNWIIMMNSALGIKKKHTNKIQGSGCNHLCVTRLLNIYRIAYALIIKVFDTKVFLTSAAST